jgi:hypothetical protein
MDDAHNILGVRAINDGTKCNHANISISPIRTTKSLLYKTEDWTKNTIANRPSDALKSVSCRD